MRKGEERRREVRSGQINIIQSSSVQSYFLDLEVKEFSLNLPLLQLMKFNVTGVIEKSFSCHHSNLVKATQSSFFLFLRGFHYTLHHPSTLQNKIIQSFSHMVLIYFRIFFFELKMEMRLVEFSSFLTFIFLLEANKIKKFRKSSHFRSS